MAAPGPDAQAGAGEAPKMPDLAALQNFQSMYWLLKKERVFDLVQFWQQRATLAEKQRDTLKEELDSYKLPKSKEHINNNNINSTNSINIHNNNNNNNNSSTSNKNDSLTNNGSLNNSNSNCLSGQTDDLQVDSSLDEQTSTRRSPSPMHEDDQFLQQTKEKQVTKLVEDISQLQSALSGVKEATAVKMHALEEQLELKNRIIHKLELKLGGDKDEEPKRELGNGRENRGSLDSGLPLPQRSLEGLLIDRRDVDLKVSNSDFGVSLSHLGSAHFNQPLRPPLPQQLVTPLPPPPLVSPLQPLAPQPPPGTPFHHLLGEEFRRSLERTALDRHPITSGQMSPDSGGIGSINDRSSEKREPSSPVDDCNMKSPSSLTNGFVPDSKSPFQPREDRSPFKDELHAPLAYKFEDRITGESLIPKGDPMEARLQEILRFNMEKYCHQSLDTLHISRRVRELLSIHNIGQRLFAKYILGLSQGTVSELLSKPKPWDKLTEKGRDSYRKMHAWATDEGAVCLLKSLIPKKGSHKEGSIRGEENVAEERIQHILSEATRAMSAGPIIGSSAAGVALGPHPAICPPQHLPHQQPLPPSTNHSLDQDSRSTDSKSPASSTHSPSPHSREGRNRIRKETENMSQEKVAQIYQEEFAKLMSRTAPHQDPLALHRDAQYPGLLFPFMGQSLFFNRGQEEMKMALDAYHQELSKIQGAAAATGLGLGAAGLAMGAGSGVGGMTTGVGPGGTSPMSMGMSLSAGGHNGAQDLSMPKRDHRNCDDEEEGVANMGAGVASRLPVVTSPFGIARIKPDPGLTLASASPLTSLVTPISSITSVSSTNSVNSCNSNASSNASSNSSSNNNGNGTIEETTTTASPLQRMASITNSLMSAPPLAGGNPMNQKPMKAVLPPITQQQFDQYSNMNTEDIVKRVKEQLSQYSISQRLFGESVLGLSQGSVSDLLARPKPWHMLTQKGREPFIRMKMFLEDDNAVHKLVASQYKIAPEKLMRTGSYNAPQPTTSKPHQIKLPADLPRTSLESPLPPVGIPSSFGLAMPTHTHHFDTRIPPLDPLRSSKVFPFQTSFLRGPGPMASSVYEMAALSTDLDTQVITTKIKEVLLANNIGQKLFGEAVLALSQGSVSELLSKPKPWHMLSIKGREPFIRMQLWLNDPHNIEKLQQLKNERREANKRRRALDPSADINQDTSDMFQVPSPGGSSKKARVLFSEEQKEALRLAFALDPYPNLAAIEFLSQLLQLNTRTITNWFHNHRMRLKQNSSSPDGGIHSPSRDLPNQSQNSFDPMHFRILLSQRLMELRKEKGLPPTLPGLGAGLPPAIHPGFFPHITPFSMASLSVSQHDRYLAGGLDLSMKPDQDGDDSNSFIDDDSNISGPMSPGGNRSDCDDGSGDRDGHGGSSPVSRPSSRRKPAAPQWVDPSWSVDGEKEREVINGVCVMQTDDFRQSSEQETVLIEPTPVCEENRRLIREADSTPECGIERDSSPLRHPMDSSREPDPREKEEVSFSTNNESECVEIKRETIKEEEVEQASDEHSKQSPIEQSRSSEV